MTPAASSPHLTPDTAAPHLAAVRATLVDGGHTPATADQLISACLAEQLDGLAAIARAMFPGDATSPILTWLDGIATTMHHLHGLDSEDAEQILGPGMKFTRVYAIGGDARKGGSVQHIDRTAALGIIRAALRDDRGYTITREPDGALLITTLHLGHQELLAVEGA